MGDPFKVPTTRIGDLLDESQVSISAEQVRRMEERDEWTERKHWQRHCGKKKEWDAMVRRISEWTVPGGKAEEEEEEEDEEWWEATRRSGKAGSSGDGGGGGGGKGGGGGGGGGKGYSTDDEEDEGWGKWASEEDRRRAEWAWGNQDIPFDQFQAKRKKKKSRSRGKSRGQSSGARRRGGGVRTEAVSVGDYLAERYFQNTGKTEVRSIFAPEQEVTPAAAQAAAHPIPAGALPVSHHDPPQQEEEDAEQEDEVSQEDAAQQVSGRSTAAVSGQPGRPRMNAGNNQLFDVRRCLQQRWT